MTGPKRDSGLDLRVVFIAAIALLLALGGGAAWAATTNNDLQAARTALGSTSGELDSAKADLEQTTATLEGRQADLVDTEQAIEADEARVKVLEFQIQRKAECIEAQAANLAEIRRILALERENFGRTTSGSTWGQAHAASQAAINLAIEDLAQAYEQAAAGNYGSSNSWLAKSNAQIRVSNNQLDAMDKEIEAINAASDAINAANDAFRDTLEASVSTCGG